MPTRSTDPLQALDVHVSFFPYLFAPFLVHFRRRDEVSQALTYRTQCRFFIYGCILRFLCDDPHLAQVLRRKVIANEQVVSHPLGDAWGSRWNLKQGVKGKTTQRKMNVCRWMCQNHVRVKAQGEGMNLARFSPQNRKHPLRYNRLLPTCVNSIANNFKQTHNQSQNSAMGELQAGLYVVGTPIGNLEDITLRALRVLKGVDTILAEDTRHTRHLLTHYDIQKPNLISYHEHNKVQRMDKVMKALREGASMALVSDAGTPTISDPGNDLVREAQGSGVRVFPIPGPSAVTTALSASGILSQSYLFFGFLPGKAKHRRDKLQELADIKSIHVFYVGPHDLCDQLRDLQDAFGQDTQCVTCRELTKLHEEFWHGTLRETQLEFQRRQPRGEFTLLVDNSAHGEDERDKSAAYTFPPEAEKLLSCVLEAGMAPSEASKLISSIPFPIRKKHVYNRALSLHNNSDS